MYEELLRSIALIAFPASSKFLQYPHPSFWQLLYPYRHDYPGDLMSHVMGSVGSVAWQEQEFEVVSLFALETA